MRKTRKNILKNNQLADGYKTLLAEVKKRVRDAQYQALKAVNKELIGLYWDIGQMIHERQKGKTWGKAVVPRLASDLQKEFPGISGFSSQNLWRMRQFYETYRLKPKLSPLVREIGWTHNVIIMMHCKDALECEFYIRMTRKYGWSKNVLALKIDAKTYESTLLNQTNFNKTLPEKIRNQAKLAVKDEYTFDFLELGEEHAERELEAAILSKVEKFLAEMGGKFAFMGSQYRLEVGEKEYFIDLLLYHRGLKCLVALELKVGEFKPEYVGKMQFYLAALDGKTRIKGENPSIGMILCRTKDRAIVEYALKESRKPIGVAAYRIVHKLPKNLAGHLPDPAQVEKMLMKIDDGGG